MHRINIKYNIYSYFGKCFPTCCFIIVSTDFSNKAAWKECFSVKDIKLPTGYYFGISATTGDLSDNHDILSIRLFELDLPDDVSGIL